MLFLLLGISIFLVLYLYSRRKKVEFKNKNILIAGGSYGIGYDLAKECILRGAKNLVILARNKEKLLESIKLLSTWRDYVGEKTQIYSFSVDCSDFNQVQICINKIKSDLSKIDICISNVGTCIPGSFIDLDIGSFTKMMQSNYFSAVNIAKCVIPFIKQTSTEKNKGVFCVTSSMAGQCSLYGMSAYSASKFALRGLIDALTLEEQKLMHICIAFPPSTETPGFAIEQITKPEITNLIEQNNGVWTSKSVAKNLIVGLEHGENRISFGLEGHLLSYLTAGASPISNIFSFVMEVLTSSVARIIFGCHSMWVNYIIATATKKTKSSILLEEKKTLLETAKKADSID